MDSQTAILAIQNNMTSSKVLTCMKHLNNLGDSDDVTIIPGRLAIQAFLVVKRRVSWLS